MSICDECPAHLGFTESGKVMCAVVDRPITNDEQGTFGSCRDNTGSPESQQWLSCEECPPPSQMDEHFIVCSIDETGEWKKYTDTRYGYLRLPTVVSMSYFHPNKKGKLTYRDINGSPCWGFTHWKHLMKAPKNKI